MGDFSGGSADFSIVVTQPDLVRNRCLSLESPCLRGGEYVKNNQYYSQGKRILISLDKNVN
ncbi:hypothetical protein SAMD00079811_43870 [Scytonema sp. HK-05]|nr:hypothetical protein SAMD00079811_43870 [Scytonema sp. HK-05]